MPFIVTSHTKKYSMTYMIMLQENVVLAYPDYDQVFKIFTDASSKQLDAVLTQTNRPIVFSAENGLRRSKSIP